MNVTLNGENIELTNANGTFAVNGIGLLRGMAEQTEEIISHIGSQEWVKEQATVTREAGIIPYSCSIIPAEREVTIDSLKDFFALQSLWMKGIFSGSNIRISFPRWNCAFIMYRTQHSPNSTDLVIESVVKSISGQSYEDAIRAVRFNIPRFWTDDQTGQIELARALRQMLKGKTDEQGSDAWNLEFMELAAKTFSFMFAAEASRCHVMLPIGIMANELVKYGEIDYSSYANITLTGKHYKWKGTHIPYLWECVKEAVGLRSACEYLATEGRVSGSNDLNKARNVISSMLQIIAIYLDTYLRLGKGARTKYPSDNVDSNHSLKSLIKSILEGKVLSMSNTVFN